MKARRMSEPSGTALGALIWKIVGGATGAASLGAALAALVVMCMTPPRTKQEWVVALVSTVVGSIAGGSYLVHYFGLQQLAASGDQTGLMVLMGLAFASGLPAWAVVRWAFNWMEKRKDKDIAEIAEEIRRREGT